MRKIILAAFIGLVSVGLIYGVAYAAVTGECVNCHTMHNSQGGEGMELVATETGPFEALTRGSCLGCHGQGGGVSITTDNIPQVYHTETTDDLAEGNFYYVVTGPTDAKGHNVEGLVDEDSTLHSTPPGFDTDYDPAATDFNPASRLTCAGQQGCHGNRDEASQFAAISGAHHGDDACLKFGTIDEASQGASVATSYRFLYKVKGGEHDEWQRAGIASETEHNEYKGETFADRTTQSWSTVDTISELCAECHGNFHMSTGIGTASPWLRHPTDAVLPNSGEYASYNPDYANVYSVEAPVARTSIPTASPDNTVTPGTDIVMCLSCHRAHASNYNDILRWDYSGMLAGTGTNDTGCFTCHTYKNADQP